MDWYDRQIIQFVVRWMPFGGPPEEETLPRFGLTPSEFRIRFREIVSDLTRKKCTLGEDDRELLASTIYAFKSESQRSQQASANQDWLPHAALF
ncbi:hypothetical protein ORI20_11175 [Mycobacterium sp. CVI_P3]|uniref:Uncharacterized protein n=1 Tax=Mycobacterium pinniadriaticum TaxID=2994102 RepID=A0ABT3SEH3_9MYCO|nr:hypothetical protein [Mycobacterium pinniadriaticum]MCX2930843.1 hypothetical protein [Mycobacterium pinniadriaticum]MCX2937267.1 hypothetical protein [Mycobacterium pinniadriaticum]